MGWLWPAAAVLWPTLPGLVLAGQRLPEGAYEGLSVVTDSGFWSTSNDDRYPEDPAFARGVAAFLAAEASHNVVDMGCGSGAIARMVATTKSVKVLALDGTDWVQAHQGEVEDFASGGQLAYGWINIAHPWPEMMHDPRFRKPDWLLSFAVAEHVAINLEHIYLANMLQLEPHGGILLAWDERGAAGTGHVNCRDETEVLRLFVDHFGYRLDKNATAWLRQRARKRWYQLVLVLRAPPPVRPYITGRAKKLASGFGLLKSRDDATQTNIAVINPTGDELRMRNGDIWKRDMRKLTQASQSSLLEDLRGDWWDEAGHHVKVGCHSISGPRSAGYPAAIVGGCVDLSELVTIVRAEHDRVCWHDGADDPPTDDQGKWVGMSREQCCEGNPIALDGDDEYRGNCFDHYYTPNQCCFPKRLYPLEPPWIGRSVYIDTSY
eukprot:TRINITY_DN47814_c0_g1_i1.p1 TRINITY_DN47814_c0_g1~~TRINITY_DN47814_c0_g1_i1.p1  ORF type:complete len:435 (-),score=79.33 TRINITY_DN47814_c0_g1_i1:318-1622(-)